MTGKFWMARRVAMALALMVGFYALALAVAAGLLWIAYADVVYTSIHAGKLIIFCVAGAGSVIWAILPRPDRFDPPGPRVDRGEEPALFAAIDEVAAATGQAPPEDVYLMNDMNAFVSQRGGFMGFGSRRVMALGLPLMQALTIDELKAVLAHEFGHFHSGDVALGPWIHKTRAALARAVERLHKNVLQRIFIAYGNFFLKITHGVSRQQELIADEVAARAAGPGAMMSSLRKTVGAGFAYQNYWHAELQPVIAAGYIPPITDGFVRFMQNHQISTLMTAFVSAHEAALETDLYDTHPPLAERVAALANLPARDGGDDARPAISLLRDVSMSEHRVLAAMSDAMGRLTPIEWTRVGEAVYVPMWDRRLKSHGKELPSCALGDLTPTHEMLARLGRALIPKVRPATEDQCVGAGWQLLISGIGIALVGAGWTPHAMPGDEVILHRDGHDFRPFSELNAIVAGKRTPQQWRERCVAIGVESVAIARSPDASLTVGALRQL